MWAPSRGMLCQPLQNMAAWLGTEQRADVVRGITRLQTHVNQCRWKGIIGNKSMARNKWRARIGQMGGPAGMLPHRSPTFYPEVPVRDPVL